MSVEKKVKLEPVEEPPVLLPPITFVATNNGVKVEERFCSVCLATVSGEVAICPKNEHYVCAAHLKEPSFKECPLCKTPWLKARDHDLENDRPLPEDEDRSFLVELTSNPALTLEEMKTRFRQAGVMYWRDMYRGYRRYNALTGVHRAALASDRNWAFFTGEWERAVSLDMREFCTFVWSQLKYYDFLVESGRFWEWILPRYSDIVLTAMSVFYRESALDDLFRRGVVDACRVLVPHCRAKSFDLLRGLDHTQLVANWLSYSLVRAQQMCELTGLTVTAAAILEAAPRIDDAAIVTHARVFFPEIGPALWRKVTETPSWRRNKAWDQGSDEFVLELLYFKPRGWLYMDSGNPLLIPFRPILLFNRQTLELQHCAYQDWMQEGNAAMIHDGISYRARELLILPQQGQMSHLEVKVLFLISFLKHNTIRMYAHEERAYDHAYFKLRGHLMNREICPDPGTLIKFAEVDRISFEKSPVF